MDNPLYNSIICYIIIISVILLSKPSFIYCYKTNKFRKFGFDEDNTLFSFPTISIGLAIGLYLIFVCMDIFQQLLSQKFHSRNPFKKCIS